MKKSSGSFNLFSLPFYFLLLTTKVFARSNLLGFGIEPEPTFCPASLAESTFIHEYNNLYTNEATIYDLAHVHKSGNVKYIVDASLYFIGDVHNNIEYAPLVKFITTLYAKKTDVIYLEGQEIPNNEIGYCIDPCRITTADGKILRELIPGIAYGSWDNPRSWHECMEFVAVDEKMLQDKTSKINNKFKDFVKKEMNETAKRQSILDEKRKNGSLTQKDVTLFNSKFQESKDKTLQYREKTQKEIKAYEQKLKNKQDELCITRRNKNIPKIIESGIPRTINPQNKNSNQFFVAGRRHFRKSDSPELVEYINAQSSVIFL